MNEASDALMSGGGARWATFKDVGDYIEGFIFEPLVERQQTDFVTKQPKMWSDGTPAKAIQIVLMTDRHEDDDDDGRRALFVRADMRRAIRDAIRVAGAAGPEIGGKLRVTHTGVARPTQPGLSGLKLYEAKYRAPEVAPARDIDPDDPGYSGAVDPDDIPF